MKRWNTRVVFPALLLLLAIGSGCGGNQKSDHVFEDENAVESDSHEDHDAARSQGRHLSVDMETAGKWGVTIIPVVLRRSHKKLFLTGEIEENQNTAFRVHARVPGIVERVTRDLGDRVRRGSTLCVLSSDELLRVKTRFVKAVQVFREAEADFRRARRLRKIRAIEDRQFTKRETAFKAAMTELFSLEADLKALGEGESALSAVRESVAKGEREVLREFLTPEYRITSPAEGRIASRNLVVGQAVLTESLLFEITDHRRVWALLDLLEKDMASVVPGTPVRIVTDVYSGSVFSGKVTVMMPRMDRRLRSVKVRVLVENADLRLTPGMFVKGIVEGDGGLTLPAVPSAAVTRVFGVEGVFVAEPEGFHFHPVQLNGEDDAGFVFLKGLGVGEKVASGAVYILKAELELRAGSGGDEHAGHSH